MAVSVRCLRRVGKAGNELPKVGQTCQDIGQECVITKQSASRVHITFQDGNGRQAARVKHPASLVLREDGLHVVQDERGFVWIKRTDTDEE
jgi:hypothetical protein